MQLRSIFPLIIFALFIHSCGSGDSTYNVEIIDNVRYISNSSAVWGNNPEVEISLVRKYGGLDETDENFIFFEPQDIAKDQLGNLYVLDKGNFRIQKFDNDGKYVATIGRQGSGPGELRRPISFDVDKNGSIYVVDRGNVLIVINENGKEVNRLTPSNISFDFFRIADDNNFVLSLAKSSVFEQPLIGVFDQDLKLIMKIGQKKDFENVQMNVLGNVLTFAIDKIGNTIMTYITRNAVQKYDIEGNLLWETDRPIDFDLSPKYLEQFNQTIMTPVSLLIGIDHKRRIWVETFKRDLSVEEMQSGEDIPLDYYEFNIFDENGIYLGDFPIPPDIMIFRIYDDTLYMIDNKEMSILEYRIIN